MARIRKGTQQIKGGPVILKESGAGGMRKLRCPSCQGTAVPTVLADGTQVVKCGSCGANFTNRRM